MRQFLEANDRQGLFFEKNETLVYRYALGECVYQISGLYLFLLWPQGAVQTNRPT